MRNNENGALDVVKKKGTGLSPEVTQQISQDMVKLGTQFISESGKVTVEYFRAQTALYYGELKAYIETETLRSEERKMILSTIENITNVFSKLMAEAPTPEKFEELSKAYEKLYSLPSKLYLSSLSIDNASMKRPERPNLINGIKNMFSKFLSS